MEILPLTVDSHRPLGNAHHAFNAPHWRQPGPFEQADGVKNRLRVEDPAAALIALAIVEMSAPALVFRQAERGEAGSGGMAVGVLRARRQRGGVPSWLIEQGQIDIALDCRHLATLAAPALPPVGQRPGAFGGFPITFISHNDVRRGQLIAEVVVADGSFIQQLAGIEDAQRGAQIDPGLIHRRGEDIEDLLWVAQTGGFESAGDRVCPGAAGCSAQPASAGH